MNIEDELEEDEEDEEDGRPALVPVEGGRPAVEVFVVVVPEGGREPVADCDAEVLDDDEPEVELFGRPPSGFLEYEVLEVELEVLADEPELDGREGLADDPFGRPPVPTLDLDVLDDCELDLLCTVTSRPEEPL